MHIGTAFLRGRVVLNASLVFHVAKWKPSSNDHPGETPAALKVLVSDHHLTSDLVLASAGLTRLFNSL